MIKKKITILLVVLCAAVPNTALAWGPERTTYTNESPAPSATFNSITNNAAVGDEREFVRIREKDSGNKYTANTDDSGFLVEPGKTYEVYIYYHNDAASNTNTTGAGVATGVKMNSNFTYKVTADEPGYVQAKITASDTTPLAVWDELKLVANKEVELKYVVNSIVIHNDWQTDGMILVAENFFSDDGIYLGVNALNGVVFGCAEYSGYVTYELIASGDVVTDDPVVDEPKEETPEEIVDTGPAEIVLATMVVLIIGVCGYYTIRTRVLLKRIEDESIGDKEGSQN